MALVLQCSNHFSCHLLHISIIHWSQQWWNVGAAERARRSWSWDSVQPLARWLRSKMTSTAEANTAEACSWNGSPTTSRRCIQHWWTFGQTSESPSNYHALSSPKTFRLPATNVCIHQKMLRPACVASAARVWKNSWGWIVERAKDLTQLRVLANVRALWVSFIR